MDHKWVKVDFPWAKAILTTVCMKVKGFGNMEFAIRYENIQHFCFICGRIGHAERECSKEDDGDRSVKFGKSLCCSPPPPPYMQLTNK